MNTSTNQPSKPRLAIPPLESRARLTRSEFERRYEGNPDIKKAELIEGVVYVASPLRLLKGDMMKVLAVLQSGLQSREHAQFVQRLGQAE